MGAMAGLAPLDPPVILAQQKSMIPRRACHSWDGQVDDDDDEDLSATTAPTAISNKTPTTADLDKIVLTMVILYVQTSNHL